MLSKVSGTYSIPYIIKAEWTSYLVFSIIFGPVTILGTIIVFQDPTGWPILLIGAILLGYFLFWIDSLRISLLEDKIVYKSMFSSKEVLYSNIKKMQINIGIKRGQKGKGFYRLEIYSGSSKGVLTINMKPFSKRDLAILADAVTTKNPHVETDDLIRAIKEDNFKAVTSAGLRKVWQIILYVFAVSLAFSMIRALMQ
jgi:hypothetical protein